MILQMKRKQLQNKVKTLTDELRQKESFERLNYLAQVAESLPNGVIDIPSLGVQ